MPDEYLKSIVDAYKEDEKKADELLAKAQNQASESFAVGCTIGCFFCAFGFIGAAGTILTNPLAAIVLIALPFIFGGYGHFADKQSKKYNDMAIQKAEQEAPRIKRKAQREFDAKLAKIAQRYY